MYDLDGRESDVRHARQDLVGRVKWLRDESVGRGLRDVGATGKELEARATNAVGYAYRTGELDAKAGLVHIENGREKMHTSHRKRRCGRERRE